MLLESFLLMDAQTEKVNQAPVKLFFYKLKSHMLY